MSRTSGTDWLLTMSPMQLYVCLLETTSVVRTYFPETGKFGKEWAWNGSKRCDKCAKESAEKEDREDREEEILGGYRFGWQI